jgi:hypothetical protein
MSDAQRTKYIAAFRLRLEDGVSLERYRAPPGGVHKMRLIHHGSGVFVEREYGDRQQVLAVQDDLIERLQAKLSEKGINWLPARNRDTGKA